jgi:hypothetical protein
LPPNASIQAHLQVAKRAIASGENDLRRAAEHIAMAYEEGASQRLIASSIGKSPAWVNRLLSWRESSYPDDTPFGPQSKASRERARVQATERTDTRKKSKKGKVQDELAAALALAKAAKSEAAKAKAEAQRATDEAMRFKAEAIRERIRAENAYADACAADPHFDRHECSIHNGTRELLVKALGMLGSDHPGERASAALVAERLRAKLDKTWNELIVREHDDDDEDLDDDDDLDHDDDDLDDDDDEEPDT